MHFSFVFTVIRESNVNFISLYLPTKLSITQSFGNRREVFCLDFGVAPSGVSTPVVIAIGHFIYRRELSG